MSRSTLRAWLTLTLFLLTSSVVFAADDTGASATDSATGAWRWLPSLPLGRYEASCDYDAIRDRVLIHGGWSGTATNSDAWQLTLAGTPDWQLISPVGSAPTLRSAAHIYDPVRDRWILFGGASWFVRKNDTYALSSGNPPQWTQLVPTGVVPGAREGAVAVYDGLRDHMIIFGGWDGASTYKNDVRVLDLANPAWSFVTAVGTPPSLRSQSCAIYDGARDRLVLFGGRDASASNNEVWTVNLSGTPTWTLISTIGTPPNARYAAGAVYDSVGDRMIVFGGMTASGVANDTWALSLATGNWTLLVSSANGPPARGWFGSAYDAKQRRMLVFGGQYEYRDTWALPLDNPVAWTLVHPGTSTGARRSESAIVDAGRDRMIVFGGGAGTDTWGLVLRENRWELLQPAGSPPMARSYHTAVHDDPRDRMIVYGGYAATALADLWSLTFEPLAWAPLTATGPSPGARSGHSAVIDTQRQRMLLFGGGSNGDVYALNLATSVWSRLSPPGGPGSRSSHGAIYDPVRDRMLIVGGGASGPPDVWALSLGASPAWTQLAPMGPAPPTPFPYRGVYDPVLDRMIVYGGDYTRFDPSRAYALPLSGALTWTPLAASPVSGFQGSQIAYDPSRNRVLLHGGGTCSGLGNCSDNLDTYELSFATTLPVPEPGAALRTRLSAIRPNPGRAEQSIQFDVDSGDGPATLDIFTVNGRRVWSQDIVGLPSGSHTLRWSGADLRGVRCAPGVYWVALRTHRGTHALRMVRVH